MPFYVYLLECRDKSLYCGFTSNLEKRLAAHNAGKASKYTRPRLPAKLVFFEKTKTKSLALKREAEIKALSRKEKLRLLKPCLAQIPFCPKEIIKYQGRGIRF